MNTSVENKAGSLDWLKWLVVVALLAGGVFANWYYQDEMLLMRVAGLLATAAVAILLALQTEKAGLFGRCLKSLVQRFDGLSANESRDHQTTLVVIAIVFVFALILWGLDSLLGWIVSSIIG